MIEMTDFLQQTGAQSLAILWFPLVIWSVSALLVHLCLRVLRGGDPLHHYNLRVALLGSLPLGVAAALSLPKIPDVMSSASSSTSTVLITIQNPLAASAVAGRPTVTTVAAVNWSNPYLWIGLLTLLLLLVGLIKLLKLGYNFYRIGSFAKTLQATVLDDFYNHANHNDIPSNTQIAFSDKAEVPFTFGWVRPIIVLPVALREKPEKLRMAIRHELMHIKHGDFLINSLVKVIKSLLWFHPLIHQLDKELKEYRELSCDADVLADQSISAKNYAKLLFELAQQEPISTPGIINMSVRKSNLQKRIKTMKTLNDNPHPLKTSLSISLALLLTLAGVMGCSQLETMNEQTISAQQQPEIPNFQRDNPAVTSQGEDPRLNKATQESEGSQAPENNNNQESSVENPAEVADNTLPKLTKDFQHCIRYPETARKAGVEGLVILEFAVNEKGWAENITVRRGVADFIDNEAKRCLDLSAFKPATRNGEPVRAEVSLPIVFRLSGGDQEQSYQTDADSLLKKAYTQNSIKPIYVIGYGKIDNPSSNLPKIRLDPLNNNGNNEQHF